MRTLPRNPPKNTFFTTAARGNDTILQAARSAAWTSGFAFGRLTPPSTDPDAPISQGGMMVWNESHWNSGPQKRWRGARSQTRQSPHAALDRDDIAASRPPPTRTRPAGMQSRSKEFDTAWREGWETGNRDGRLVGVPPASPRPSPSPALLGLRAAPRAPLCGDLRSGGTLYAPSPCGPLFAAPPARRRPARGATQPGLKNRQAALHVFRAGFISSRPGAEENREGQWCLVVYGGRASRPSIRANRLTRRKNMKKQKKLDGKSVAGTSLASVAASPKKTKEPLSHDTADEVAEFLYYLPAFTFALFGAPGMNESGPNLASVVGLIDCFVNDSRWRFFGAYACMTLCVLAVNPKYPAGDVQPRTPRISCPSRSGAGRSQSTTPAPWASCPQT